MQGTKMMHRTQPLTEANLEKARERFVAADDAYGAAAANAIAALDSALAMVRELGPGTGQEATTKKKPAVEDEPNPLVESANPTSPTPVVAAVASVDAVDPIPAPEEPTTATESTETEPAKPTNPVAPPIGQPEPVRHWRDVSVAELGLNEFVTLSLTGSGFGNLGAINDLCTAGHPRYNPKGLPSISGIGKGKAEKIIVAIRDWWGRHPEMADPDQSAEVAAGPSHDDDGAPAWEIRCGKCRATINAFQAPEIEHPGKVYGWKYVAKLSVTEGYTTHVGMCGSCSAAQIAEENPPPAAAPVAVPPASAADATTDFDDI